MSCIGAIYNNMGEGLFTRAEMTLRQLHHESPPQHAGQFTEADTWSTLHSLAATQQAEEYATMSISWS